VENEYFYKKFKKMQHTFEITNTSRKILFQFLEKYTVEQLNKIPEGFSNNLIWNIGHIVVVQQMLVYKLSGLPMMISDEMVNAYKKLTLESSWMAGSRLAPTRRVQSRPRAASPIRLAPNPLR